MRYLIAALLGLVMVAGLVALSHTWAGRIVAEQAPLVAAPSAEALREPSEAETRERARVLAQAIARTAAGATDPLSAVREAFPGVSVNGGEGEGSVSLLPAGPGCLEVCVEASEEVTECAESGQLTSASSIPMPKASTLASAQ
ncbi:hypothetical protein [Miltoncostaea oceani]|uniref:hypothetical protein n=1 Tax=Miltoncostaea oceani TaxID=2843216 RepID=UPI001C3E1988|nr:hypothetical protein [Miltoncostaea oceani]